MIRILDQIEVAAPVEAVFEAAARVERWPAILPHYRWVRFLDRPTDTTGLVEMAAYRPFGIFNYPTWWTSEMEVDRPRWEVRYRHVRGITTGMVVAWRLTPSPAGTRIDLTHDWRGPAWPVIRWPAARWVILPVFVHGIAARTLAGLKREVEAHHG